MASYNCNLYWREGRQLGGGGREHARTWRSDTVKVQVSSTCFPLSFRTTSHANLMQNARAAVILRWKTICNL